MSTLWSRPIMHVEVVKLALSVVKGGKTSKAVPRSQCINIVHVITCHPLINVRSGKKKKKFSKLKLKEKFLTRGKKESSTYIIYRNQLCHLMLQLWKLPRKILSPTSVNKSVNSSSSIDNRSTLSKPTCTSADSLGLAAQKPAASTTTKSVAANLSYRAERNTQ